MAQIELQMISNNTEEVKKLTREQIILALESIGSTAEGYAIETVPTDTGRLKNSITYSVDDSDLVVYVGTNVEYAVYVEYGTGKYAEGGGGRQTPWFYKNREGQWIRTEGMKPTHFLRDACENHVDHFEAIFKAMLNV